jgi:hypothetical protein
MYVVLNMNTYTDSIPRNCSALIVRSDRQQLPHIKNCQPGGPKHRRINVTGQKDATQPKVAKEILYRGQSGQRMVIDHLLRVS